jgi:hypothetical protein
LYRRQGYQDGQDVVTTVFYQKLLHLIKMIDKDQIFGAVAGFCAAVEFQKRYLIILNYMD